MNQVRVNLATETYDVAFWRTHALRPGAMGYNLWGTTIDAVPRSAMHMNDALSACINTHIARAVKQVPEAAHVGHLIDNMRSLRLAFGTHAVAHPVRNVTNPRLPLLEALHQQLEALVEMGRVDPLFGSHPDSGHTAKAPSGAALAVLHKHCKMAVAYYDELTEAAQALRAIAKHVAIVTPCYREPMQAIVDRCEASLIHLTKQVLLPDMRRIATVRMLLRAHAQKPAMQPLLRDMRALQKQLRTVVQPALASATGASIASTLSDTARALAAAPAFMPCVLGAFTGAAHALDTATRPAPRKGFVSPMPFRIPDIAVAA